MHSGDKCLELLDQIDHFIQELTDQESIIDSRSFCEELQQLRNEHKNVLLILEGLLLQRQQRSDQRRQENICNEHEYHFSSGICGRNLCSSWEPSANEKEETVKEKGNTNEIRRHSLMVSAHQDSNRRVVTVPSQRPNSATVSYATLPPKRSSSIDARIDRAPFRPTSANLGYQRRTSAAKQSSSSYSNRFLQSMLLEKEIENETHLNATFKATPVPANTYLPLYEELAQKAANRSKMLRVSAARLLSEQSKPFNLSAGKKHSSSALKRCVSADNLAERSFYEFKARSVPASVISTTAGHSIEEDLWRREQRRRQRSQDLLKQSRMPASMQVSIQASQTSKTRHHRSCLDQPTFSPEIHRIVPDFAQLHKQFEKSLSIAKHVGAKTTVPEPFNLYTEIIKRHQHFHEEHPRTRNNAGNRLSSGAFSNQRSRSVEYRGNTTATLRNKALKENFARIEEDQSQLRRMFLKQQKSEERWRETMQTQLKREQLEQERRTRQKQMNLRNAVHQRALEYKQFLQQLHAKTQNRPSVVQQQEMFIKKQQFERLFLNALKDSGLSERYLSVQSLVEQSEQGTFQFQPMATEEEEPVFPVREAASGGYSSDYSSETSSKSSSSSSSHRSMEHRQQAGVNNRDDMEA